MTKREKADLLAKLFRMADSLRYELAPGIHTYHQCPCGRSKTRAGRCWRCWLDEMNALAKGAE